MAAQVWLTAWASTAPPVRLMERCGLKSRLRRAEAQFLAELDRSTLADIALGAAVQADAGDLA